MIGPDYKDTAQQEVSKLDAGTEETAQNNQWSNFRIITAVASAAIALIATGLALCLGAAFVGTALGAVVLCVAFSLFALFSYTLFGLVCAGKIDSDSLTNQDLANRLAKLEKQLGNVNF